MSREILVAMYFISSVRDKARDNSWAKSTSDTYTSAFNSWVIYCKLRSLDPNCCSEFKNSWREEFLEDVLCDYIAVQCGIRGLSPNSIIKTYLPGIAYTLEMKKNQLVNIFLETYIHREK